jgi:fumarate reductase subunit C
VPAPAHPGAMAPARPGPTRTAPPRRPDQFPFAGRYRAYTLFDATGILYLLVGFVALRAVWALGDGPGAWQALLRQFQNPLYVAFHALCLVSVVFVAVRFFRLFPKAQPPRIGPAKPPPRPLILAGLYAAWIAVTALMTAILAGWIF